MTYDQYRYDPYRRERSSGGTGKKIAIGCGIVALVGFILTILLVLAVLVIAVDEGNKLKADNTGDTGITFAGKQPDDVAVMAGSKVTVDKVDITASTLGTKPGLLDGQAICSKVTITNNSEDTVSFNEIDWSMQKPGGEIETWGSLAADDTLSSGQLAAGGTKTGDVCFTYPDTSGEYVLLYEPDFWSDNRYAWVSRR